MAKDYSVLGALLENATGAKGAPALKDMAGMFVGGATMVSMGSPTLHGLDNVASLAKHIAMKSV